MNKFAAALEAAADNPLQEIGAKLAGIAQEAVRVGGSDFAGELGRRLKAEGFDVSDHTAGEWLAHNGALIVGLRAINEGAFEWFDPHEGAGRLANRAVRDFSRPLEEPNPGRRKFLYGGAFVRQKLTVLGGSGGMMKSTAAVTLTVAMAAGQRAIGMDPAGGPLRVAYTSTEDERDEVLRVVKAAAQDRRISAAMVQDRLLALGQDSLPDGFRLIGMDPASRSLALDEAGFGFLDGVVQEHRSDLLIVDPLFGAVGGTELTPEAMNLIARRLVRLAQARNIAVLLIHHTRKSDRRSGVVHADELTGGKPLVNAARAVLTVREVTADEAERWGLNDPKPGRPGRREIRVIDAVKVNLSPTGGRWSFRGGTVMLDDPEGGSYEVQVARDWTPPITTHGVHASLWPSVAEIVEREFVLASDRASGRNLKGVIEGVCRRDAEENGVRHDPRSFLKDVRARGYVEARREKRNPGARGEHAVQRAVLTPSGREAAGMPLESGDGAADEDAGSNVTRGGDGDEVG